MNGSFGKKIIEVRIALGDGTFRGEACGKNTKIIRDLVCSVEIRKPGLPAKNNASVRIYGMRAEDMETLTMLDFQPLDVRRNSIAVYAGDERGLSLAFAGDIGGASADYNAAPDVAFSLRAVTDYCAANTPAGPFSCEGEVAAAEIFQSLARQMGKSFANRGVSAAVRDVVLDGSPWEKAVNLARQLRVELTLDDEEMIVAPAGAARDETVPLWSAATGLKGYPSFSQKGITATALYDPAIRLGGLIRLQSVVPRASGLWRVYSLSHKLETLRTGGAWETSIEATYADAV